MKTRKMLVKTVSVLTATALLTACGAASSSDSTAPASTSTSESSASEASTGTEFAPMKIAFAPTGIDDTTLEQMDALENEIGPALNIEFMFSEAITDAGALTTFIENAYASGCDAVYTNSSGNIDQAAAVCNDLGMYFVGISSSGAQENQDLPYYVGVTGASAEGYANAYKQVMQPILSDGEQHSVVILSGAACYGATSYIEGTVGSLEALQEAYGLTYTEDIYTLATSEVAVDCENDKGLLITVCPGMTDLANVLSPLLQTGNYDVVVGNTSVHDNIGVMVDEVEREMGIDIKLIGRGTFSDSMYTAFNSSDSQGSPVLNGNVLNGVYEHVAAVVMLRNAFDGYADNMRDNGQCSRVPGMDPLVITSAEEYNALSGDDMPFSFVTTEDLLSLCGPDVTWQDIDEFGANLTTENILAKFGK